MRNKKNKLDLKTKIGKCKTSYTKFFKKFFIGAPSQELLKIAQIISFYPIIIPTIQQNPFCYRNERERFKSNYPDAFLKALTNNNLSTVFVAEFDP